MMRVRFGVRELGLLAVLLCAGAQAGQPQVNFNPGGAQEQTIVRLEPGMTYRTVNGMPITGTEIIELLIEESKDKYVQMFAEFALRQEEIQHSGIHIPDGEVEAELQLMINEYARRAGLNPKDVKLETLAQQAGLLGGLEVLRREIRLNLGLIRALKAQGKLKDVEHQWDPRYKQLLGDLMEKRLLEKGIETDPAKLGTGEVLRIGARGYSVGEFREFLQPVVAHQPLEIVQAKLAILAYDKLVKAELAAKGITLTETDGNFHFNYFCRKLEADTGIPGRNMLAQSLQGQGLTIPQYMQSRMFKFDTGLTRLAKEGLTKAALKAEFEANRAKYDRKELKTAHIVIRVLDPDGRPYGPGWKSGHPAVDEHVARVREQQFAAFKPKLEALIPLAQADFAATARKHSEDSEEARKTGGVLGRVGANSVLPPPCDDAVRDAALKLKPGEMSPPVRSAYGWHLVRCLDDQTMTYDEAAERVYINLIHQNKLELEKRLMNTAKIEDRLGK